MNTLFARARAYQPLAPAERAILKLLEGLLTAALVAALPVVATALSHGAVNWSSVAQTALAAGATAALLALAKYCKAQGDPALGDALTATSAALAHAAGLSDDEQPAQPADS